jgi:hypothetical protein
MKSGSGTRGNLEDFLKDNRSPDAVFPNYQDEVSRAHFGLQRTPVRRLPPGTALRLMIAASLLIWVTLIVLFLRFFA